MDENWVVIPEFRDYAVSDLGRFMNVKNSKILNLSKTGDGSLKITLVTNGEKFTRSARRIVAECFVYQPTMVFDTVINLNNNLSNIEATNLRWRPRWFAWKYAHQFNIDYVMFFYINKVRNIETQDVHNSIMEAAMVDGVLVEDINRSIKTGEKIFPHGHSYTLY